MPRVELIVVENPLAPEEAEVVTTDDLPGEIMRRYPEFPPTARLYEHEVSLATDVTPVDQTGVDRLDELEGRVYLVVYPGDPATAIAVLIAVVAVGAALYFSAQIPNTTLRNTQSESPNNSLSNRTNQARPNGRIPDIYGEVRSVPDLIQVPYKVFDNHEEYEIALMCIGRGSYDIPVAEIKDDTTPVTEIVGASVIVYGPNTSPNSGSPQLSVGTPIDDPLREVARIQSVNGQLLRPPNNEQLKGQKVWEFVYPDVVKLAGDTAAVLEEFFGNDSDTLEDFFAPSDEVQISKATHTGFITASGYDETFSVRANDSGELELETGNTSIFTAGEAVNISNAIYTNVDVSDETVYKSGSVTILDTETSVDVVFAEDFADTNFTIMLDTADGSFVYFTDVTVSGFTIRRSGSSGSLAIDWAATKNTSSSSGSLTIDLSGTYVISAKTSSKLTLQNPENVDPDWDLIAGNFSGNVTPYRTVRFVKPESQTTISLAGTYTVLSVSPTEIQLSNPVSVNADWSTLQNFTGSKTAPLKSTIAITGQRWVGPFTVEATALDSIVSNFVALNGLFKDDGEDQTRFDVTVELEVTPIDSNGDATGSAETFTATVLGSSSTRRTRAQTLTASPTFSGRCRVRARRLTPADIDFEGSVVDEIQWRDLYSMQDVGIDDFGNVTIAHVRNFATQSALSVKDRKINLIARRLIPERTTGTTYGAAAATSYAADIIAAVAQDPYIGNQSLDFIDVEQIYEVCEDIQEYFGLDEAAHFNYTFDKDNLSYEEILMSIASAIFCQPYRRGQKIQLAFERSSVPAKLLFNHRNKLPGSETRTLRFGTQSEYDGIELEYVSPEDDAIQTLYLPSDKSAVNPKRIESIGIRNESVAAIHINRAYNVLTHQRVSTEFECTQEGDLLVQRDKFLSSNGTRVLVNEGQIESVDGLTLGLSQACVFDDGVSYSIFLQLTDETTQSIAISPGADDYTVTLDEAPRVPLVTGSDKYAPTTYKIVGSDDTEFEAFILKDKDPLNNFIVRLTGINYTFAYYMYDGLHFHIEQGNLVDLSTSDATLTPDMAITQGTSTYGYNFNFNMTTGTSSLRTNIQDTLSYTYFILARVDTDNGPSLFRTDTFRFKLNTVGGMFLDHDSNIESTPQDLVTIGQWHTFAASYDSVTDTYAIYLDGLVVAKGDGLGQNTPSALRVGEGLIGRIGSARVYRRALDAEEIKSLHSIETKV